MKFLYAQKHNIHFFFCGAKSRPHLKRVPLARYIKKGGIALFIGLSLLLLLPDSFYAAAGRFFSGAGAVRPSSKDPGALEASSSDDFCERISEKLLRLHILADSDSLRDQEIKLHVRDAVLAYAQPLLSSASSAAEAEAALLLVLPELTELANRTLKQYGAGYTAYAAISTEFFPIRRYGSLLLPPGSYRALRIVLGTGRGHNWWCMLYPSLCFTEGITGTISVTEQEKMEQLVDQEDYSLLFSKKEKPELSFRLVELFQKLKHKRRRKS